MKMKFGEDLSISIDILQKTQNSVILELVFVGAHDHAWPYRDEIYDYIKRAVEVHKPSSVLLNFMDYFYEFGNEIFAPILLACCDMKHKSVRPCSILAKGETFQALRSLINEANMNKVLKVEFFTNRQSAVEFVLEALTEAAS